MKKLQTKYMGLTLQSPLIVGSSGLTKSVKNIKEYAEAGAGAVVLKSLFEEEISHEINRQINNLDSNYDTTTAYDYISNYSRMHHVESYMDLIRACKKEVDIPIIASVNCVTAGDWMEFASKMQNAGADALELNIFILPNDFSKSSADIEKIYFDILAGVKKNVSIPVSLKLSSYFSSFANTVQKLSWSGADAIVLFNRFYSPDINIYDFTVKPTNTFSTPDEIHNTLRWIAILSGEISCDLAATTGIHSSEGLIKAMLAGANAVQIVSALYKNGAQVITNINNGLHKWMSDNNFESTSDFIGKMSYKNLKNPAAYDRVQFMKHFAEIE
ncbi:MAG: dihydroorotate dehydrogenase-like protein [Bacteroidales bacterium]|jgi:dihydroorotate dehydrogenase (fumarate)